MSDTLTTFLIAAMYGYVLVGAVYGSLLFGADAILAAWQRRREERRQHQAALGRIDRDTEVAVARLVARFVVTQQRVREEAAATRGVRR